MITVRCVVPRSRPPARGNLGKIGRAQWRRAGLEHPRVRLQERSPDNRSARSAIRWQRRTPSSVRPAATTSSPVRFPGDSRILRSLGLRAQVRRAHKKRTGPQLWLKHPLRLTPQPLIRKPMARRGIGRVKPRPARTVRVPVMKQSECPNLRHRSNQIRQRNRTQLLGPIPPPSRIGRLNQRNRCPTISISARPRATKISIIRWLSTMLLRQAPLSGRNLRHPPRWNWARETAGPALIAQAPWTLAQRPLNAGTTHLAPPL